MSFGVVDWFAKSTSQICLSSHFTLQEIMAYQHDIVFLNVLWQIIRGNSHNWNGFETNFVWINTDQGLNKEHDASSNTENKNIMSSTVLSVPEDDIHLQKMSTVLLKAKTKCIMCLQQYHA